MIRSDARNHQPGFTMVEILITLIIAGVLLSLALPSFQSLIGDNQIVSTTNEFVSSVHVARSEAIKRDARVGMCPSSDPLAANPVCSTTAAWTSGWIVFVDDDEDGLRDSPGEELLQRMDQRSGGFVITPPTVFQNRVYFESDGTSIDAAGIPVSGQVTISYGADEQRNVNISATGRVQTVNPAL